MSLSMMPQVTHEAHGHLQEILRTWTAFNELSLGEAGDEARR